MNRFQPKRSARPVVAGFPHAARDIAIIQHADQCFRQASTVSRRDKQSRLAFDNDFHGAACPAGDGGFSQQPRFDVDQAKRLPVRRQAKNIHGVHHVGRIAAVSREADIVGKSARACRRLEFGAKSALAHDPELGVRNDLAPRRELRQTARGIPSWSRDGRMCRRQASPRRRQIRPARQPAIVRAENPPDQARSTAQ